MKTEIENEKLFRRLPVEFITIYEYVMSLGFETTPDYTFIRR
jgi:hypothetical protein